MTSAGHGKLEEQLRFREIDVVVTPFKVIDPDLQNLQNIEVPVNLICTIDKNCVLKKKTMDINSALKHLAKNGLNRWVMPSTGLKLRTEINQFFESSNIDGRVVFESDVMESLTKSVVDKIGVAFLPLIYVPKELENKTVHSLGPKAGYWKHRICLASHTNKIEDPLLKSLSHSFKDVCNPLISR
jgi:DNA-binding transcriptional LysR family regulator